MGESQIRMVPLYGAASVAESMAVKLIDVKVIWSDT
jgi:hypothetical protein